MPRTRKNNRYDEVNISEADGVRYLHLGYTPWVQGAMRIARPWKLEIAYIRDMMCWHTHASDNNIPVQHIAQLGLGAASLTKHCYRTYPQSQVTAIELNPKVIAACRQFFKLMPNDIRLNVLQLSADDWVNDPKNHGTIDVLQVDLYDSAAQGPVFDSVDFYLSCRACLSPQGMMTVNLFGGAGTTGTAKKGGFKSSYQAISTAFDGHSTALAQTDDGNVVVLAWRSLDLVA
jgi:spermidine synthase